MNFSQIEYYIAICEENSISQAAKKLFITQSALSQQLLRLESELGTQLFLRQGNSLILTESGREFLDSARTILFEYRNVRNRITDTIGNHILTLAVTKTKSFITLCYLLPGFRRQNPDIRVEIKEVDSYQVESLLIHGEADLGFCYGSDDANLIYHDICDEPILLAVPPEHSLAMRKARASSRYPQIHFSDIANEPFIVGENGYLSKYTVKLFERNGITPNIVMKTSNPGLVHLLVAANIGMAFIGEISSWIAPRQVQQPKYFVLRETPQTCIKVALAHHRKKHVTYPMKQFIAYAREELGKCINHRLPLNASVNHS